MVLHIDILTVEDVVEILERTVKKEIFVTTEKSLGKLKTKTLLANIHAKIVNTSPRATVEVNDGIVVLGNLEGSLKSDKKARTRVAESIIQTYGVKDVVFEKPVKSRKHHINTFYNMDLD
jgi:phosphosulfolactate synthase (CoM biosynthesis protein A)